MRVSNNTQVKQIVLQPGDFTVSNENVVISTILGSCVSACMFDPLEKIVGMNHFLLSSSEFEDRKFYLTKAGRYGVHAMELVINGMMKLGAKRKNLRVKAFGGGRVLQSGVSYENGKMQGLLNVAGKNVDFITNFLKTEKIPLESENLGGNYGRVVHFFSEDYSVLVRKIRKADHDEIINKEKRLWQESVDKIERDKTKVEYWR